RRTWCAGSCNANGGRDQPDVRAGVSRIAPAVTLPLHAPALPCRRAVGAAVPEEAMTWLLPGMDGTALLYEPLLKLLGGAARALPLRGGGYDEVHASLPPEVREPRPHDVLVAESFSGPLALRIAAQHEVARVVLVASFIKGPSLVPPGHLVTLLHPPP